MGGGGGGGGGMEEEEEEENEVDEGVENCHLQGKNGRPATEHTRLTELPPRIAALPTVMVTATVPLVALDFWFRDSISRSSSVSVVPILKSNTRVP